jgi:glycosyltransferase involved in cell wall biosynthesis
MALDIRKVMITGKGLSRNNAGGIVHVSKEILAHLDRAHWNVQYFDNGSGQDAPAWQRPIQFIGVLLGFWWTLLQTSPQLVHINTSLDKHSISRDVWFIVISKLLRIPVFLFVHGWNTAQAKSMDHLPWHLLFKPFFELPDQIGLLSEGFTSHLSARGIAPSRMTILDNMVNCDIVKPATQRRPGPMRILFMARIVADKGIEELLGALLAIKAKGGPALECVIAGDGPNRSNILRLVSEYELESTVSMPGYVGGEDKLQALQDADIFVFPTRYGEGKPIVLLEAMAAGLPLITTRAGGIGEILRDGEHGVILSNPSVDKITSALIEFEDNSEYRLETGRHNRSEALDRFDSPVIVARIADIYSSTCGL